ncbi:MAG: hypothetical protein AAAB35_04125 [Phyllobacterium sp.]|uniref:hypothetical protein n=1 Tax=Phyllobacterium sp. TaxID=1871046 RepID=UPI0030F1F62B
MPHIFIARSLDCRRTAFYRAIRKMPLAAQRKKKAARSMFSLSAAVFELLVDGARVKQQVRRRGHLSVFRMAPENNQNRGKWGK